MWRIPRPQFSAGTYLAQTSSHHSLIVAVKPRWDGESSAVPVWSLFMKDFPKCLSWVIFSCTGGGGIKTTVMNLELIFFLLACCMFLEPQVTLPCMQLPCNPFPKVEKELEKCRHPCIKNSNSAIRWQWWNLWHFSEFWDDSIPGQAEVVFCQHAWLDFNKTSQCCCSKNKKSLVYSHLLHRQHHASKFLSSVLEVLDRIYLQWFQAAQPENERRDIPPWTKLFGEIQIGQLCTWLP